jgi:pyridoxine 5-phosphate synthase
VAKLSVNVNKVALLRNTRDIGIPSVRKAAETAAKAGAHGITVHPRPDQRHIRPADVYDIAGFVASKPELEFNIEGNPFPDFMELVRTVRPHQCTLVPDSPNQSTSDHGWDIKSGSARLQPIIAELHGLGCRVSVFMDADVDQIQRVAETGADRVELYTQPYAAAFERDDVEAVWIQFAKAAEAAQKAGLGVNAGHDLNLHNLKKFLQIPGILEVSIGHALIADALDMGLSQAVRAYLAIISSSPGGA